MFDLNLFKEILEIDSTSGKERDFAEFLSNRLLYPEIVNGELDKNKRLKCSLTKYELEDKTMNLLFSWGKPRVYFCTHIDTVPPYIPPKFLSDRVLGRGACDAKGQIFSMYNACLQLEKEGFTDFALLLLSGEEIGSFGAKDYTKKCEGGEVIIVGEPTDNKNIVASKGTKAFKIKILGKPCHSGYPHLGNSAVEAFIDFMNNLRSVDFPIDPVLGETTFNVGELVSNNPQNILSEELNFRLYFRTTGASDDFVVNKIMSFQKDNVLIDNLGGDKPMRYYTFDNIDTDIVCFGSDAPRLDKFEKRALCGPGSIFVAHTHEEYILYNDIEVAINQYVYMAKTILDKKADI